MKAINFKTTYKKRLNAIMFLFISLYLFFASNIIAQTVSYTYKPLAAEGCNMKYNIAKQNEDYFIVATVHSDRMIFLGNPTMKIKTFNGSVLELNGIVIGSRNESLGFISGTIVIPVTEINSTAQFSVTPEQMEVLKEGVEMIRLSMTPMNHERTFKKDKIGKKLYQFYKKAKEKDDIFSDGKKPRNFLKL